MTTRPPAVAGVFYPADPTTLAVAVERFVAGAAAAARVSSAPKAIIAPHAGYSYSGPVAGSACAPLRARAAGLSRVVLLGPAHRVPLRGVAGSGAAAFRTPLGEVPVDRAALEDVIAAGLAKIDDEAHRDEHSLEVLLPFLQILLPRAAIVPLVVGRAAPEEVARVIDRLWGDDETAVVVSSDLSHYLPYPQARAVDTRTAAAIEALRSESLDEDSACGVLAIMGLLHVARQRGLTVRAVDLRNSGDTAGSRDEVVGYGAFLLS